MICPDCGVLIPLIIRSISTIVLPGETDEEYLAKF